MRTRDTLNGPTPPERRAGRTPARALLAALALVAVFALQAVGAPAALAHGAQPAAIQRPARALHALPIRTDPAANAILSAPPSQVKMWFSEALNPVDSRIVVVDPSNHEVDNHDSRVDMSNQTEMVVGLQLLRPGTYVVVWRAQSTDDGHVTGGSFIFRIANADGSVPPVPATLPSGNVPGAAGFGASAQSVDAPTLLQALGDWLALLFALFWVGSTLWEVWVLPVRRAPDAITALGARLATRRFQRLAPYALAGALLADVIVAAALVVQVAGSWSGLVSGQYWQATILSGSEFGIYWWMRQITLLVALVIALLTERAARQASQHAAAGASTLPREAVELDTQAAQAAAEAAIPSWTAVALETLRQTPRLPLRLARGWLDLTPLRQAEAALGLLLLFAFAMSGHAAATPPSERGYAITVDLLHLIFSAIWLGGLLYISVVLIPAARDLPERLRAALLARGAPEFGAIAIVSAALLALTGSLNATVHLTSFAQFATTAYGRTLFVKIELFLIMVAISAFHAFWLRPRLTRSLAQPAQTRLATLRAVAGVGAQHGAAAAAKGEAPLAAEQEPSDDAIVTTDASAQAYERAAQNGHAHDSGDAASDETRRLRAQMQDWLRREAIVGVGVLLCVALLALFAGTLTPTQAAPVASSGAFKQTQTVSGYAVTLQVNPAKFGQNTFTVTVADAHGAPATGASALLLTDDLDMDMGTQSLQLQPVGVSQPGVYSGQGQLTMAGAWRVTVKVLPPGSKTFLSTQYKLVAGS